jgi:quinolinate synthase
VTRQQRMGEQSRLSTWPDVNVLRYVNSSRRCKSKVGIPVCDRMRTAKLQLST